jgi:hypothetical protein
MAAPPLDPIRPTDDEARALARRLMAGARHGALGVLDPASGGPLVSRVAVGLRDGAPLILVSSLALHARALRADPRCSLLLGEPGDDGRRGDPLAHPRLTLVGRAEGADKAALRAAWLADHPKAALYYDFADFALLRLRVGEAHLNGGFGRAFRLLPEDLADPPGGPA